MGKKTAINGVPVFWFGFDDAYRLKIEAIVSGLIHSGDAAYMAWDSIGNAFIQNDIPDVSWNCDNGVAFYKIGTTLSRV